MYLSLVQKAYKWLNCVRDELYTFYVPDTMKDKVSLSEK